MYGKLFTQMYDGTLATEGPWQALVTFQQLIILSDRDGVVDMTSEAISRRTTIPLEIIELGIAALELPDPNSRSPDEDGRRIVRLSDEREWGWKIVNYAHYRNIRSQEERREYMRNYQRKRRSELNHVNTNVNFVSKVNQSSKQNAEEDKTYMSAAPTDVKLIFDFWRETMGHLKAVLDAKRRSLIKNALKNYSTEQIKAAIKGCSVTPFNMGENDRGQRYDDLSLILRSSSHIERFIRNHESPPKGTKPDLGEIL